MKRKEPIMTAGRKISLLLTTAMTLMLILLFTISVNALGETGRDTDYKITNGVWESTVYVTDSKDDNVRTHILRISKGADVTLKAASANYYKSGSTADSRKASAGKWGFSTVEKMMAG